MRTVNETLKNFISHMSKYRIMIMVLAVIVTIVTVYSLILPAITLEKEEAEEQGGIDVAAETVSEQDEESVKEEERLEETQDAEVKESPDKEQPEEKGEEKTEDNDVDNASDEVETDHSAGSIEGSILTKDKCRYKVTVDYEEDAGIPSGAVLNVKEIRNSDKEYDELYDGACKKAREKGLLLNEARFLDITIMSDDSDAAVEIEPESPVHVRIVQEDVPDSSMEVFHFNGKKVEEIEASLDKVSEKELLTDAEKRAAGKESSNRKYDRKAGEISFTAESFSVYGLVTLDTPDDLDGKTYGIVYYNGASSPTASAVSNSKVSNNPVRLQGTTTTVRTEPVHHDGNVLVASGGITMWTFHQTSDGRFHITTQVGSDVKYLMVNDDGVFLVDYTEADDCLFTIIPGTGNRAGKYLLQCNGRLLFHQSNQFRSQPDNISNRNNDNAWMTFAETSSLTEDDFVTYTAEKVSVSDTEKVPDGAEVVLYTRVWNERTLKYEYYVLDSDGKLVLAYEGGDTISWVGSAVNTMLWDFTEYHYDDGTPNYYYELQNQYSGKYLAPQVSKDSYLSDSTIGVNLNGRRYNRYYTTIIAWDDDYYDYASIMAKNGDVIPVPMSRAQDFYFAIMKEKDPSQEDKLTTVKTIDHTQYGITLKMQDYSYQGYYINKELQYSSSGGYRSLEQSQVLGYDNSYNNNGRGLVSKYLDENGYPIAAYSNTSLGDNLYSNTTEVKQLFLESTYQETGYFEYDSTQNFAHLITDPNDPWLEKGYDLYDFVVYDQLGTHDFSNSETLKHGQFLPYNDLKDNYFSNKTNDTDLHGDPLSSLDPRKGEKLYKIPGSSSNVNGTPQNPKLVPAGYVDHFFGMEMSASFMQSENGLDDWGHDLIFEFSGDDDFWLYVDDMLVLDLGGVHSAQDGNVNFRTGAVYVNGTHTTLRAMYEAAFRQKNPDASNEQVAEFLDSYFKPGTSVFKDYSGHTMRMFYMERGASASNLHMRFNLAPYTKGEVLLEKKVTGADNVDKEFAYQIFTLNETASGLDYELLDDPSKVTDHSTGDPIPYSEHCILYPEDPSSMQPGTQTISYNHVFFLKPGQIASIKLEDESKMYFIRECCVDQKTYDHVYANNEELVGHDTLPLVEDYIKDFPIEEDSVSGRKKVVYNNHVRSDALKSITATKRLWQDDDKQYEIYSFDPDHHEAGQTADDPQFDNTEFRFRIMMDKGNGYEAYNTGAYRVKNTAGEYCIYENGAFKTTGKTDFSELSTEIPEGEWKSEQEKATFYTSPGGAADKIKAGYSIEIPGLLAGAKFKIEERDYEMPVGYNILGYNLTEGPYSSSNTGTDTNEVIVGADDTNKTVSVHNQHGYGLLVNKIWADADFMQDHDPIYFGVYKVSGGTETLITDTVRQLDSGSTSIRWFFPEIDPDKSLNDYKVYELMLQEGKYTVEDGVVMLQPDCIVTKIGDGEQIIVGGHTNDHGYSDDFIYTADYDRQILTPQQVAARANSRTDSVTNGRPGIRLIKTTMNGTTPLEGATFTMELTDHTAKKRFTSDEDGLIAVAYIKPDSEYILTETGAPYTYQALIDNITIKLGTDGQVYVNGSTNDGEYYTIKQVSNPSLDNMPSVTIKNRKYTLRAEKQDAFTEDPLPGVHFALYREVIDSVLNAPRPAYEPIEGFEDLVSGDDGLIEKIDLEHLRPGTYYLRETSTYPQYQMPGYDIRIIISSTGRVQIQKAVSVYDNTLKRWVWQFSDFQPGDKDVNVQESEDGSNMIVIAYNTPKKPAQLIKRSYETNGSGQHEPLDGAEFELYEIGQIQNGKPKEGETPVLSGTTGVSHVEGEEVPQGFLSLGYLESSITYYLFETKAPDGYELLTSPIIINVNANCVLTASLNGTPLTVEEIPYQGTSVTVSQLTVYNSTGVELPNAGGPGTHWIYIIGGLLVLICGVCLVARKRVRG